MQPTRIQLRVPGAVLAEIVDALSKIESTGVEGCVLRDLLCWYAQMAGVTRDDLIRDLAEAYDVMAAAQRNGPFELIPREARS